LDVASALSACIAQLADLLVREIPSA
jgi:hypothetical protein